MAAGGGGHGIIARDGGSTVRGHREDGPGYDLHQAAGLRRP